MSKYLSERERKDYLAGKMTFDELKIAVAQSLFMQANEYDLETYTKNKAFFEDPDNFSYQQLDIEKLRQIVAPLPSD